MLDLRWCLLGVLRVYSCVLGQPFLCPAIVYKEPGHVLTISASAFGDLAVEGGWRGAFLVSDSGQAGTIIKGQQSAVGAQIVQ